MKSFLIYIMMIIIIINTASSASALWEMLDAFNAKYNTTGTRLDSCDVCHISDIPQKDFMLNSYGRSFKSNLNIPVDLALTKIEPLYSDGSGFSNIDEIRSLVFPGNKTDLKININRININDKIKNPPIVTPNSSSNNIIQSVPGAVLNYILQLWKLI